MSADAAYCGQCGARDRHGFRQRAKARRREDHDLRRRGYAIFLIVVGTFASLVVAGWLADDLPGLSRSDPDPEGLGAEWAFELAVFAMDATLGVLAVCVLGPGVWRHALGRRPEPRGLALALPAALVMYGVATGYVVLLDSMSSGGDAPIPDGPPSPAMLVGAIVLAPLAEEWLCRAALWVAIRPVTGRWTAIVATATVFAFLHGLNGLLVLELPHRFVMGMALGWLRARTGSLWPCVLAHALHNSIVMLEEV